MRLQICTAGGIIFGSFLLMVGLPNSGHAQMTSLVSVSSDGEVGNQNSRSPSISADERFVAFESFASNLVPGDTNAGFDVFVHDRQTGVTTRVSIRGDGGQAIGSSHSPAISADGRFVAFISNSSNLVAQSNRGVSDVYVHDRKTGVTSRVSVDRNGSLANGHSSSPVISADGRFVAFQTEATNLSAGDLDDTNQKPDVFWHDRQTGLTLPVSGLVGGNSPAISGDGRFVAFVSDSLRLAPEDTRFKNEVFVFDSESWRITRVSVSSEGVQGNGVSRFPSISLNGRFVAFISSSFNLTERDVSFGNGNLYVYDRQTGTTTFIEASNNTNKNQTWQVTSPVISTNGRFIAFLSDSPDLVHGDTDFSTDVFVHDRQTEVTTWVTGASKGIADGLPFSQTLSGDGRFVAFDSIGSNLVPGLSGTQVYVFDRGASAIPNKPNGHDLNGDGKADLVWRNTSSGVVAVWLMDGTAMTSSGFLGGVPAEWQIAGVGDVNGDGKADVVWRNVTTGTVAVWLMNGHTITSVGFPGSTPTEWDIQAVGDVNGDGKADLVWRNTNDGNTAIWFMNGAAIASSSFPGGVSLTWQIAGVGDVNGNGKADVIWRNTANGTVAVWVMAGPSIASFGFPGSAPLDWVIAGIGDIDGNGTADLVWNNPASVTVAVWLMNGAAIGSSGFLGGKTAVWEMAQVGDADGDGQADLIWFNTSTGEVEVWLMNGLAISSTGSPGTTSPSWEIQ